MDPWGTTAIVRMAGPPNWYQGTASLGAPSFSLLFWIFFIRDVLGVCNVPFHLLLTVCPLPLEFKLLEGRDRGSFSAIALASMSVPR